jgi:hypothetical protein
MRSIRSLLGALFSASLILSFSVTPAFCVDCTPALQAEARAKQTNNPNDWLSAGNTWLSSAKFGQQDDGTWRPNERSGHLAMARRAVACFQKSFDISPNDPNQHRGIEFDSRLRSLMQGYDMCARLDPNNGLWYYLAGEQMAGLGHYREAEGNLKMAVRLGAGQPAGQRATALLAHIEPFVKRDDAAHSADSPQMGNILQNQRGGGNAHLDQLEANYDRIHGQQSHGNAAVYRTEGNYGN